MSLSEPVSAARPVGGARVAAALRVVDLGKRYFHRSPDRPRTLQERCIGRHQEVGPRGEYWGLRHVSFSLEPGTALGVIGANGAGKSTLLRLSCGIGRPDEGAVQVTGRVNALLDLNSGFHSELTGRENVFIGAMTAGLRRAEVGRLMDEIVDFSGLEGFIDDPLRTYSIGMQARLGFAVAMAVLPNCSLLAVDEVLAVGDSEFSARCLERIRRFLDAGGAVLVASHSMGLVRAFCERALWLRGGHAVRIASSAEVTDDYLAAEGAAAAQLPS